MEEVVTSCKAAERMAADAQAEIDAIRSKGTEQKLSAVQEGKSSRVSPGALPAGGWLKGQEKQSFVATEGCSLL